MNPSTSALRASVAVVITLVATLGTLPAAAQGPTLNVTPTQLTGNGPWTVNVAGSRYLVPPHAPGTSVFGGVYLQFGWVRPTGGWGPSFRNATNTDGQFGVTYHYPGEQGDGSTRDDGTGTAKFIAFTPGGIDATATDIHMDPAGNWSTTLVIAAPTYTWIDPATGASQTVDCRKVQCGVYTIGAHGKASRTNELFVPVTFTAAAAGPGPTGPPATGGISQTPGGGTGGSGPSVSPVSPQPATPRPQRPAPRPGSQASATPSVAPAAPLAAPVEGPEETAVDEPTTIEGPPVAETTTSTAVGRRVADQAGAPIPIDEERRGGLDPLLAAGFVAGVGGLGAIAVVLARRRHHC